MSHQNHTRIETLIRKGVRIPNPLSIEIGEEVDLDRISATGVIIHSGCRIFGSSTLILRDVTLGDQGPVTIRNCQLGPDVQLHGGFFREAVFLEGAEMGPNALVREGTILEEKANAAHCVGLKQTILFPFVTLGSLINFCDCLMTGGTGRKDHSEVGSSYIHFNYTPNQDKATPSLLGDVPRGVMLDQPPIFLGGQGGLVGPCRLAFGTVTAAGIICRKDELRPGRLLYGDGTRSGNIPFIRGMVPDVRRITINNIIYIANLIALRQWYYRVRVLFISDDFPDALYHGLVHKLIMAMEERLIRFEYFCRMVTESIGAEEKSEENGYSQKIELFRNQPRLDACLRQSSEYEGDHSLRDSFLQAITSSIRICGKDYISVIQGLGDHEKKLGTQWLQGIVDNVFSRAMSIIPSFGETGHHRGCNT